MSKVYVVTSGSYSEYGICRVFMDKEKADKYVEMMSGHLDMEVEEFEVSDDITLFAQKVKYYNYRQQVKSSDYKYDEVLMLLGEKQKPAENIVYEVIEYTTEEVIEEQAEYEKIKAGYFCYPFWYISEKQIDLDVMTKMFQDHHAFLKAQEAEIA